MALYDLIKMLTSLSFWEGLLNTYVSFGPLAAVLLAALESIVPGLPFIAITALNVAAHGYLWGFFYSWLGSSLGSALVLVFYRFVFKRATDRLGRKSAQIQKARDFVARFDPAMLLLLLCFPVTPSSLFNFMFGLSDYSLKKYALILFASKLVIVALFSLFGDAVSKAMHDPVKLVPACLLMAAMCYAGAKLRKKYNLRP